MVQGGRATHAICERIGVHARQAGTVGVQPVSQGRFTAGYCSGFMTCSICSSMAA
jgi:hypothetical protein